MPVTINLSTPLLKTTGGEREICMEPATIEQMMEELGHRFPALISAICDGEGRLKNVVSIYLNDHDIRFLDGVKTGIKDGDEVYIIPTIAGG